MEKKKELLKKHHPYFREWPETKGLTLSTEKSRSGPLTLKATRGGKHFFLHSRYDPELESKNVVQGLKLEAGEVVFVLGLGLGYHLEALVSLYPEHDFIVLEREMAIFRAFLERAPEALLIHPRIFFFPYSEKDRMNQFLPYLYYIKIKQEIRFRVFKYQPACSLFPFEYEVLEKELWAEFSVFYSNRLTERIMEPLWKRNSLRNLRSWETSSRLKELEKAFSGKALMIVSAGPSLERKIDLVRKMREQVIVVSVDTALRFLVKNGLFPDYVLCLDAKYENLADFKFLSLGDRTELIYDIVAFPKIVEMFRKRRVAYTLKLIWDFQEMRFIEYHDRVLEPLIARYGDWGGLQSGGSVSTNAFDLALFTDARTIYLVGLDLYYFNYKTHCRGTYKETYYLYRMNKFYNYETLNFIFVVDRENLRETRGNDVYHHDYILRKYKRWFEQAMTQVKGKKEIRIVEG